jgi:hypothetical protein
MRRVPASLSSAFPLQALFAHVLANLQTALALSLIRNSRKFTRPQSAYHHPSMRPWTSTIILGIYPPTPPSQPNVRPPVLDLLIIGEKCGLLLHAAIPRWFIKTR